MYRMSSLDRHYHEGHLSVFPRGKDSKFTLYEARNNAESYLKQTLSSHAKYLILTDGSRFPDFGLIRITNNSQEGEVIFYSRKIGNQLHSLHRGFHDNRQYFWSAGCKVSCPVMSEHNNALRDAVVQIQRKVGVANNPEADSINGILTRLERRWLSPKPIFRAYPRSGKAPLKVHFHNFSGGHGAKFLWEFGDGTTSTENSPTHAFMTNGSYTVKLNMMSSQGNQAVSEKASYISVNQGTELPVFYAQPAEGFSKESASVQEISPSNFTFIDQSDVGVVQRNWSFGDGHEITIENPNIHTVTHVYDKPGEYKPSLIINMENQKILRPVLIRKVIVL